MKNKWYWAFKHIFFGPALRVWNRPWAEGMDNIPKEGPAILVSNHQAVMDSFYFPLMCPRQITFLAKSEYFTTPGLVGRMQNWFFSSVGQVPVERDNEAAGDAMLDTAKGILARGDLFGIYPEGTRSPDGRIYKGRTGMARIAFATGEKVIPIAMIGTRKANPIGSWIPRPVKVGMRLGTPIDPLAWARDRGLDPEDRATAREFTDYVMHTLSDLSGNPYVDFYASEVKASLNAGHGYPRGAEPGGEAH
ncbi:1-acyl-sn-glycerol-3-phosphate acyltransferase [Corynebacterium sp.]|uniref:lysophospholipid acyltransferase family protein n=1 Tax=Corynebacterium sp. TaxID=1720 RepID=UPI0026DAC462|nr:lysophospholipid acyltransferase family protein [Corynebacterium sp.]MDO5031370.1 lysophospholipid acyltransferase family protein [Corynebacterium sp.]